MLLVHYFQMAFVVSSGTVSILCRTLYACHIPALLAQDDSMEDDNRLFCNLQPFWYFGLESILQKWCHHSDFHLLQLRMEGIAERRGSFMDAEEYSRLEKATSGISTDPDTLRPFSSTCAWIGQLFKTAQHSTGVFASCTGEALNPCSSWMVGTYPACRASPPASGR